MSSRPPSEQQKAQLQAWLPYRNPRSAHQYQYCSAFAPQQQNSYHVGSDVFWSVDNVVFYANRM